MSSTMELYYIADILCSVFIFAGMILLGKQLCSRSTSFAAVVQCQSREVCLKCRILDVKLQLAYAARVKKAT